MRIFSSPSTRTPGKKNCAPWAGTRPGESGCQRGAVRPHLQRPGVHNDQRLSGRSGAGRDPPARRAADPRGTPASHRSAHERPDDHRTAGLYRTRALMRSFAACERLRLLSPEAPGAHQAPRRGFAASWQLPRAWPGGARAACDRRASVSLLPPPRSARTASRRGGGSASPTSKEPQSLSNSCSGSE